MQFNQWAGGPAGGPDERVPQWLSDTLPNFEALLRDALGAALWEPSRTPSTAPSPVWGREAILGENDPGLLEGAAFALQLALMPHTPPSQSCR